MSDPNPYTLFLVARVGGALFSIGLVLACICACRACRRKERRPVRNNNLVVATITQRDGQNYPMVFDNGEWRSDRSGQPPLQNQPYQAGAPLPQNPYAPLTSPMYNPPPYPHAGEAAPPYTPPSAHPAPSAPPPSYSVAVRGGRDMVDIRESQAGARSGPEGLHPTNRPSKM